MISFWRRGKIESLFICRGLCPTFYLLPLNPPGWNSAVPNEGLPAWVLLHHGQGITPSTHPAGQSSCWAPTAGGEDSCTLQGFGNGRDGSHPSGQCQLQVWHCKDRLLSNLISLRSSKDLTLSLVPLAGRTLCSTPLVVPKKAPLRDTLHLLLLLLLLTFLQSLHDLPMFPLVILLSSHGAAPQTALLSTFPVGFLQDVALGGRGTWGGVTRGPEMNDTHSETFEVKRRKFISPPRYKVTLDWRVKVPPL